MKSKLTSNNRGNLLYELLMVGAIIGSSLAVLAACGQSSSNCYYNTSNGCLKSAGCLSDSSCWEQCALNSATGAMEPVFCVCGSPTQYCSSTGDRPTINLFTYIYDCDWTWTCDWNTWLSSTIQTNLVGDRKSTVIGCPS
jgi:hypothetical protein